MYLLCGNPNQHTEWFSVLTLLRWKRWQKYWLSLTAVVHNTANRSKRKADPSHHCRQKEFVPQTWPQSWIGRKCRREWSDQRKKASHEIKRHGPKHWHSKYKRMNVDISIKCSSPTETNVWGNGPSSLINFQHLTNQCGCTVQQSLDPCPLTSPMGRTVLWIYVKSNLKSVHRQPHILPQRQFPVLSLQLPF